MGVIMDFDIDKVAKLILLAKRKNVKEEFTEEEVKFMSSIFNTIINSENYDSVIEYLAGIHCISVSDIKFIRNAYFLHFATKDEKLTYNKKMKQIRNERKKNGFINLSMIVSFIILIGIIGISLALFIYNL